MIFRFIFVLIFFLIINLGIASQANYTKFNNKEDYSTKKPNFDTLTSFDVIRNIPITEEEKKIGMINFNEFLDLYIYNYLDKIEDDSEKNFQIAKLNSNLRELKYSKIGMDIKKQAPVILHWSGNNSAMGTIKYLFKFTNEVEEGVIGVDYVITEPLANPDYPDRKKKAYIVKLSGSYVATTWYKVPNKLIPLMYHEHKKYNKAISIEIVGWKFLRNPQGLKGNFGINGELGIRENFNNSFDDFDEKYQVYPSVLKLVNYLAEQNNFATLIDNFNENNEISKYWKKRKNILYLDGELSKYLKGHGLIAIEHSLKYNSNYINTKADFSPKDLLVLYSDLKKFRIYNDKFLIEDIENNLENTEPESFDSMTYLNFKNQIKNVVTPLKRDYLFFYLYILNTKITSMQKFDSTRGFIDYLLNDDKEKLTAKIIQKYLSESYETDKEYLVYLKNIADSFKNKTLSSQIDKLIDKKDVEIHLNAY